MALISGWLARHVSDRELAARARPRARADPGQAEAVDELRAELATPRERAELEMVAREALETLAVGG